MDGNSEHFSAHSRLLPPSNVRILEGDEELAVAVARAADGARRLDDRLAARAARDAWMVEHTEQRVGWLRFVRAATEDAPCVTPAATRRAQPVASSAQPVTSRPPAA